MHTPFLQVQVTADSNEETVEKGTQTRKAPAALGKEEGDGEMEDE